MTEYARPTNETTASGANGTNGAPPPAGLGPAAVPPQVAPADPPSPPPAGAGPPPAPAAGAGGAAGAAGAVPDDCFPDPDTTRRLGEAHGLPPGHWLDVRQTLTWGQELKLQAAITGRTLRLGQQELEIDFERVALAKVLAWVTAWSLTLRGGAPAPLDEATLRALHPRVAAAINAAVDAHIAGIQEGNAPRPSRNGSTPP
jgi:hypothetical protein